MPSPDPDLLRSTLLKVALPLATLALVLFAARRRGLSWRDGLGLRAPRPGPAAGFLVGWAAWLALSEFASGVFGLAAASPWPACPPSIVLLRVAAIGLLGPAAEELLMRGLALDRLRRTKLGATGAVLVVALFWAAMHVSYGPGTILLIALDGVWLGAARLGTRSIWVPIAMHAAGNLLSIAQSLAP